MHLSIFIFNLLSECYLKFYFSWKLYSIPQFGTTNWCQIEACLFENKLPSTQRKTVVSFHDPMWENISCPQPQFQPNFTHAAVRVHFGGKPITGGKKRGNDDFGHIHCCCHWQCCVWRWNVCSWNKQHVPVLLLVFLPEKRHI